MTELGQKVIGEVRRLAKENPKASAGCKYFEEDPENGFRPLLDQPCCIVGHAVYNLKLVYRLADSMNESWGWNVEGVSNLPLSTSMSKDESEWLAFVQTFQDDGYKWGDALDLADEEMC